MNLRWISKTRLLFTVLALVGLAVGLATRTSDLAEAEWPSVLEGALALVLGFVALMGGAWSWAILRSPGEEAVRHFRAFLVAQPAKYLPAGFLVQAGAQIELSADESSPRADTTGRFLVHSAIQVVSATTVAALFGLGSGVAWWVSGGMLLGSLCMAWILAVSSGPVVRLLGRFLGKPVVEPKGIPSVRLAQSIGVSLIPILATGTAFHFLLGLPVSWARAVSSYAIAWVVGYLAIVIPSGIGVRESVLAGLIGGPSAPILAVSLLLRLVVSVTEAVAYTLTLVTRR